MTREPDRYEAKARLDVRACFHYGTICTECHAAALRQAESSALERAAQEYGSEDLANIKVYCRHVAQRLRELKSPAAAPAAETCRAECASRMPCALPEGHVGPHRDYSPGWTVAPPSEPAVPAPDWWTDAINKAAAINHEILARAETAEALLRECEEVLRSAKQSDNAWFGGEFYDRLDRVIRRLAARAAPTSTPSDGSAET